MVALVAHSLVEGELGWHPYVQPRAGHTINPEALQALCARKLAGYKRTTSITVMDAIPKNAVGKTDKAPLRAAHLKGTSG
jgi:acyl-CoA synthetase (AMP-forming)/AMP-acid ligase II